MAEPLVTWTGKHFHPWNAKPEEVCIEDIAHALSMQCRFNGHVDRFYSVAEHSVIMSRLVPEGMELAALLHDAAEAYIGDMAHPLKVSGQLDAFNAVEELVLRTICAKFDVEYGQTQCEELRVLDRRLCATEAKTFFPESPGWTGNYKPAEIVPEGLTPKAAEKAFLARFKELTKK
jgi:hypothetical protein